MEVAVITGGTRGIGAWIAATLAERKVRLILNGRHRDSETEQLLSKLNQLTEVQFVAGDSGLEGTPI